MGIPPFYSPYGGSETSKYPYILILESLTGPMYNIPERRTPMILDYSRGLGKTRKCIEESVKTGHHILVTNLNAAHSVAELARQMGYDGKLPYIIKVDQILKQYRNGMSQDMFKDLIVDEADAVLEMLLNDYGASHSMATFTADEVKINTGDVLK